VLDKGHQLNMIPHLVVAWRGLEEWLSGAER